MRTLSTFVLFLALAVGGCGKKAEPPAPATTDKDRLQGVWAVESVECGVELAPPARQRLTNARLHVSGNRLTFGEGGDWEFYGFGVDTGREPYGLLLHEVGPDGQPPAAGKGIPKPARSRGWIYKFDGEKLVVAFSRATDSDSVPPPADFKAEPGQNVALLRLAKTNEEPRTKWDARPVGPSK